MPKRPEVALSRRARGALAHRVPFVLPVEHAHADLRQSIAHLVGAHEVAVPAKKRPLHDQLLHLLHIHLDHLVTGLAGVGALLPEALGPVSDVPNHVVVEHGHAHVDQFVANSIRAIEVARFAELRALIYQRIHLIHVHLALVTFRALVDCRDQNRDPER